MTDKIALRHINCKNLPFTENVICAFAAEREVRTATAKCPADQTIWWKSLTAGSFLVKLKCPAPEGVEHFDTVLDN